MRGKVKSTSASGFSTRALRTLSAFGLTVDDVAHNAANPRMTRAAAAIASRLSPGQIALLTGPSGSGKSCLLTHIAHFCELAIVAEPASKLLRFRARAVDVVGAHSLDAALGILSAAGLADARLMVARVGEMSEGERARIALARAMDKAAQSRATVVTLVVDEFAASLDPITGAAVAATLARWVRRPGSRIRLVVAGNHDSAAAALAADLRINLPTGWAWDAAEEARIAA